MISIETIANTDSFEAFTKTVDEVEEHSFICGYVFKTPRSLSHTSSRYFGYQMSDKLVFTLQYG